MAVAPKTMKLIIFGLICGLLKTYVLSKRTGLNVAVIGAGAAGLACAKHALEYGYNVTIYEKSEKLGGVWFYTDEIGNASGIPVHSATYKGLRCLFNPFQSCICLVFHWKREIKKKRKFILVFILQYVEQMHHTN